MVKMRSTVDNSEMDVDEATAYALQAKGQAYNVDDAERKAAAVLEGNFSSVTGRVDAGVAEAPVPVNASDAARGDTDDDEGAETAKEADQPVRRSSTKKR